MEEKIGNILYSLIPLVLIIVFSWLFGRLGQKMRKQDQGQESTGENNREFQLADLFAPDKEGIDSTESRGADQQRMPEYTHPASPAEMTMSTGGPPVSAKPIKPKWWGA